ncbi:MAG: hypothetical protein M1822_008669 [Bathelium mastoideum]|nr:MAG: hypothetical protein M1822_008669 [Bathelium mastoideum]
MAVALTTSKRKFDKLLNNLTNDSPITPRPSSSSSLSRPLNPFPTTLSSSTSQAPSDLSSLSTGKRLRSSPPSIRTIARERLEAKKREAAAAATTHKSNTSPNGTPTKSSRSHAPRSQPAFLARLRTFADVTRWTPKPDALSEVVWARRGWVCEGGPTIASSSPSSSSSSSSVNTVACRGGCEARVVVRLRPHLRDGEGREIAGSEDYGAAMETALVERYVGLVVDGHGEGCIWRRIGCREDVYHLPLARRAYWQDGLRERWESVEKVKEELPRRVRVPDGAERIEALMERLPTRFFREREPDQMAVKFALYGWQGEMIGKTALASCPHCFARIGLWMYKREEVQATQDQARGAYQLDLVESHRYHCPWRNATSQASPGDLKGLAGWQVLQRVILNSTTSSSESLPAAQEPHTPRPASIAVDADTPDGAPSIVETPLRPATADVAAADKIRLSRLARLKRMMTLKPRSKK